LPDSAIARFALHVDEVLKDFAPTHP
jgi:hypothetical protein